MQAAQERATQPNEEERLRVATEALRENERQIAEAKAEVGRLTGVVQNTDPDAEPKKFSAAVTERALAAARLEALEGLHPRLEEAAREAARAVQRAALARLQEELRQREQQIQAEDAALAQLAHDFAATLERKVAEHEGHVDEATRLAEVIARQSGGNVSAVARAGGGLPWAPVRKAALPVTPFMLPALARGLPWV